MVALDRVPAAAPGVATWYEGGEAILWGRFGLPPVHLDRTATALWSLVDGRVAAREIANDLIAVSGLEPDEAEGTVAGFLAWLDRHGVLDSPSLRSIAESTPAPARSRSVDPVSP